MIVIVSRKAPQHALLIIFCADSISEVVLAVILLGVNCNYGRILGEVSDSHGNTKDAIKNGYNNYKDPLNILSILYFCA